MIRIGVAGWDYPDWSGVVYPRAATRGFDRLAYLARFVDVVEINSTFYRPADPKTAASWVRRTARSPGFRFTAKAHRSWTHDAATVDTATIEATLRGLAPLREAGMLGALLIQFPQSFHRTPASVERLERLLEGTRDWPVVVEVRHVSWDDDHAAVWLRGHDAGWCVVDQPRARGSTAPARARVTSRIGYLRMHGRNEADWFREGAGRDARYDYLYTAGEIAELAAIALGLAEHAETTFVIQNNHFRGQALVNALQLRRIVQGIEPPAPAALVEAYPELSGSVVPDAPRLI